MTASCAFDELDEYSPQRRRDAEKKGQAGYVEGPSTAPYLGLARGGCRGKRWAGAPADDWILKLSSVFFLCVSASLR